MTRSSLDVALRLRMPVLGDHDQVLDPHPELARARRRPARPSHDVACLEHVLGGLAQPGRLMDLEADAVAEPVAVVVAVPRRPRSGSREARVRVGPAHARPDAPEAVRLGAADELVDLARLVPRSRRSRRSASRPSSSRRASRPCRRRRAPPPRSPGPPGSAVRTARRSGPTATIAGKAGSAPSSRIRACADSATSRSVLPASPRSASHSNTSSARRDASAIASISPRVLDPARAARPGRSRGRGSAPSASAPSSFRSERDAGRVLVVSDPALEALGELGDQPPLERDRARTRRRPRSLGPLRVAEVGEELAPAGADDREAAGAGEAR